VKPLRQQIVGSLILAFVVLVVLFFRARHIFFREVISMNKLFL